jgi:tRNA threonylcarbamoyladenosine biosynthesis protein TsaB
VAQGLAFGAGLPVVPISDLRALAQRVMELDAAVTRVLVCNDARMHEVYWCCFERAAAGAVAAAAQEEQVGKPATVTLPASWSRAPGAVHAAGSGFAAYPELRSALAGRLDRVHDGLLPRAAEIARLAVPEVVSGHVLPAEQALPVYLRDDVAHAPAGSH